MEGTGKVVSLAPLRHLVADHTGIQDISSGNQQDAIEFLTLLLELLPSEFSSFFDRHEQVSFKYFIYGQNVPCPNCGTFPHDKIELEKMIHLSIPNSNGANLSQLLHNHYEYQINHDGKRCSNCCPHGDSKCPGTFKCVSMPLSEQRQINKFPQLLLIQIKRFQHDYIREYTSKIQTDVDIAESINIGGSTYMLKGIINHMGTYDNRHYTLAVKRNGKWYLLDGFKQPQIISGREIYNGDTV